MEMTQPLVSLFVFFFMFITAHARGNVIRVGALLPRDRKWPFAERYMMPAARFATQHIQNTLLPNAKFEIVLSNRDTQCNEMHGMNHAINYFIEGNVSAFFGPTCDFVAAPVARQVTFWNKPMISVGAWARDFMTEKATLFPLLTRAGTTNLHILADAVVKVMRHNQWSTLKLIYDRHAFSEINPDFCHLCTSSLVYGIPDLPEGGAIKLDYFKFPATGLDVTSLLRDEIGIKYSSKINKNTHDDVISFIPLSTTH